MLKNALEREAIEGTIAYYERTLNLFARFGETMHVCTWVIVGKHTCMERERELL